ncbi:MAG: DUF885 domain-containing protein [Chloroflexi bacterium]|nr:DUF885 domain-containing protein [Chloroflexota bacterium]
MIDQLDGIAVPVLVTETDHQFAGLVRTHLDVLLEREPVLATYLGIHDQDERLGDMSRAGRLELIQLERQYLADLEALDPTGLSEPNRLERELAMLSARRALFDGEVHRLWERRVTAGEEIGDAVFLLFVRDFAPLSERLTTIAARLEAAPLALTQVRDRLGDDTVALWLQLELDAVESLPGLLDVIVAAGVSTFDADDARQTRLALAADGAREALAGYGEWISEQLPEAGDDFALGREHLDELIALRAFDGLTTDEILAIGREQLALHRAARAAAAAEIDPQASEADVLVRVKADHPADFDAALLEYRTVMDRARAFIESEGLVTLPANAPLDVVPTPEYLRQVTPFAAYFAPAAFDQPRKGIYIVTPSVDDDPGAMLEHNRASISNTSIHEAYPGHHLQLSAALERPTITRLLIEAPEFVEGWGMYSEQLMREQGFDATPAHRMMLATDAIWRACRIILDIQLHRGEIGVDDAIDFLIDQTGFERPNAAAEVHRYTSTPTYQLSYLLGKVLILRLREDERQRLGDAFSLRDFHAALMWSGSIPVSFHRRLLAGEGGGPFRPGAAA